MKIKSMQFIIFCVALIFYQNLRAQWAENGQAIFNTNTGNVGIGLMNPQAKLQVNGSLLLKGGAEGITPVSGEGERLMWIPAKGAFRAGRASSNEWNDINIGEYSIAFGNSAMASGKTSFATGRKTIASGDKSTAMGYFTLASGEYATALGAHTTASNEVSTALGVHTEANGIASIAMGYDTRAENYASTAMGYRTKAIGAQSTAMGWYTEADGDYSTAAGAYTSANGAISTALGSRTTADAFSSLALGRFNEGGGNPTQWISADPLFEIGIGSGENNRKNAITVLKDGRMGIATSYIPEGYKLAIDGKVIVEEIEVQISEDWPDFVFQNDYELASLASVEEFVQENRHLPGIPSEQEVRENGINLGQMDALLLQKIEELTLHLITQNKRIEALERENIFLKSK